MVPAVPGVCIDQFEFPNKPGVKPRLGLSGIEEEYDRDKKKAWDAERLCKSVGKRVCRDYEWIAACEGAGGTKYPFGEHLPKYDIGTNDGLCNYDKYYKPVDEYLVFKRDQKHMSFLDQSEPAGNRKTCQSWSGAFDMVGNAEEWVRCKQGREGWCLASRFWAEPRSCNALVASHSPRWHYYDTGTRCCLDIKEKK
jgi:formylglycine-generating enzyme required for sulfatase activity